MFHIVFAVIHNLSEIIQTNLFSTSVPASVCVNCH